ncbi:hypothetical protein D3C84_658400 [compost metagenome]
MFDRDVGGNCCAVHDQVDFILVQPGLVAEFQYASHHGDRLVLDGGGHLVFEDRSTDGVFFRCFQDKVGIGTANIYTYARHFIVLLRWSMRSRPEQ